MRSPRQALRRAIDYVWDNPSAEQDARTILVSPKVGLWLGLEVLLIIIATVVALFVLPEEEDEFRRIVVAVGTGPYLTLVTLGVVTLFLTLIVPLRAVGLLEGPRWRGYLDQVVTTGITPLRYFLGKWATSQPFFLALLGASLPFVTLFGLLGGATLGRTLAAYGLLYLYANLLLVFAAGLGVVVHEVGALITTWLAFGLAQLLATLPAPSSLACFSPLRFILQPVVAAAAGSGAPIALRLYGDAHVLGLDVPWVAWALGCWTVLAAAMAVACVVGPPHAFLPGVNNFGAVVLHGDSKRAFLRRLRPFVTRRVELAFLFENRGPRLVRWTLPLNALSQAALLGLLAVTVLPVGLDPALVGTIPELEVVLGLQSVLVAIVFGVALYVMRSGRMAAAAHASIGGLRVPHLVFDAGVMVGFCGLVVLVFALGYADCWRALVTVAATPRGWRQSFESPEQLVHASLVMLDGTIIAALSGFLVLKLAAARLLNEDQALGVAALYVFGLVVVPVMALGAAQDISRAEEVMFRPLAGPVAFFGLPSPISHVIVVMGELRSNEWLPEDAWLLQNGFWLWHAVWLPSLLLTTLAAHRSVWREAAVLEGARPPATAAPCPRCEARLSVPAGWTAWGGVVGTWLAGAVRCAECQEEYLARTGAKPGLLGILMSVGRAALGTVVLLGLIVGVAAALAAQGGPR